MVLCGTPQFHNECCILFSFKDFFLYVLYVKVFINFGKVSARCFDMIFQTDYTKKLGSTGLLR